MIRNKTAVETYKSLRFLLSFEVLGPKMSRMPIKKRTNLFVSTVIEPFSAKFWLKHVKTEENSSIIEMTSPF